MDSALAVVIAALGSFATGEMLALTFQKHRRFTRDLPGAHQTVHLQPTPRIVAFTAFAISGLANAVNIMDGFNGLAAGATVAWNAGDAQLAQCCLRLRSRLSPASADQGHLPSLVASRVVQRHFLLYHWLYRQVARP